MKGIGAVLLLIVFVSGCLGGVDDDPFLLADLEACDFLDGESKPVACVDESTVRPAGNGSPTLLDGYVCTGGFFDYTYYQSVSDPDAWALAYTNDWGDRPRPTTGVAVAEQDGVAVALYTWSHGPGAGYVELPPLPDGAGSWGIWIYQFYLESEDPVWEAATVTPLWSIHGDSRWVVWRIDSDYGTHYVQNMGLYTFEAYGNSTSWWTPFPIESIGEDFHFTLTWYGNGGLGQDGSGGGMVVPAGCPPPV